jgi:hypothetical protein
MNREAVHAFYELQLCQEPLAKWLPSFIRFSWEWVTSLGLALQALFPFDVPKLSQRL